MLSPVVKLALYAVPILILIVFIVWMQVDPYHLAPMTHEDGWIENLTAIGYGVGSLFFVLAAWRVPLLHKNARAWAPAMTICWAILAFFCMGEEISWGQRIFNEKTPKIFEEYNTQDETNIHNLGFISNNPELSEYRMLSIYMVLGGLGIPIIARVRWGKKLVGWTYFPVVPWCYCALWAGAYIYGKYYRVWVPIPNLKPEGAPTEIREMMVGLGTAFFAAHAYFRPSDVYIGETPPERITPATSPSQAE